MAIVVDLIEIMVQDEMMLVTVVDKARPICLNIRGNESPVRSPRANQCRMFEVDYQQD